MMKQKGFIFDFDGTLFDSMGVWVDVGRRYLRSRGIRAEQSLDRTLAVLSLGQAAEYLRTEYSLPETADEIIGGILRMIETDYRKRIQPKPHVREFLEGCRRRKIRMCIATASERELVEAALRRCGMEHFFLRILSCTELGTAKDDPYIYERACVYLKTEKAETAVFEDAFHAAQTAKSAGYFVVGVYDKYEKCTEDLQSIADLYVRNLAEAEVFFQE